MKRPFFVFLYKAEFKVYPDFCFKTKWLDIPFILFLHFVQTCVLCHYSVNIYSVYIQKVLY